MQILADRSPHPHAATIFLFQPRWLDERDRPGRMPYRLVVLLGALRARGHRVVLAEEAHDGPPSPEWREAMRAADLCVAWCAEMYPGTQIPGILRFLEVARFEGAPPVIAGGGFFPLIQVERLALEGRVDGVALEPGEVVVPAALEAARDRADLAAVPGVQTWKDGVFRPSTPPRRAPLDPALLRVLRELDLDRYGSHVEPMIFDNLEPAIQVPAAAGCAKRCAFCFDERSPYGAFPAHAIVETVAFLARERGIRQVLLGDLDFFHRKDRALAVARGLAELARGGAAGLRWFALASIVDLCRWSDAELDLLAGSGCHRIELGSESGSAAELARLGKRHAPKDAVRLTARLAARGVRTTHNLLLGAPGHTAADRAATLALAGRLATAGRGLARLQPRLYQIVPRTSLGAEALRSVEGPAPGTLEEILDFRRELETGLRLVLPWLEPRDELWTRQLTEYVLPLAYGDVERGGRLRGWLRRAARLRCRLDARLGVAWDQRLFARAGLERVPGSLVR